MSISILKALRSPVLKNRQTKLFNFFKSRHLPNLFTSDNLGRTPLNTSWNMLEDHQMKDLTRTSQGLVVSQSKHR